MDWPDGYVPHLSVLNPSGPLVFAHVHALSQFNPHEIVFIVHVGMFGISLANRYLQSVLVKGNWLFVQASSTFDHAVHEIAEAGSLSEAFMLDRPAVVPCREERLPKVWLRKSDADELPPG